MGQGRVQPVIANLKQDLCQPLCGLFFSIIGQTTESQSMCMTWCKSIVRNQNSAWTDQTRFPVITLRYDSNTIAAPCDRQTNYRKSPTTECHATKFAAPWGWWQKSTRFVCRWPLICPTNTHRSPSSIIEDGEGRRKWYWTEVYYLFAPYNKAENVHASTRGAFLGFRENWMVFGGQFDNKCKIERLSRPNVRVILCFGG